MAIHPELELLGAKIRAIRERKGWSQEEFALESGLARSYYSGVERGRRNLAAVNLIKIASTLGVEVGELFPEMRKLRAATRK